MGMKQRLGVAAALLKEPEVVVLDEPTNGLDPAGITDMRALLRTLAAEGCTVVLSSHLLAEVEQVLRPGGGRLARPPGRAEHGRRICVRTGPPRRSRPSPSPTPPRSPAGLLGPDAGVGGRRDSCDVQAGPDWPPPGSTARSFEADVDVTGLRQEARTLEEVFLQMTGRRAGGRRPTPGAGGGFRRRFGRRAPVR